MKSKLFKIGIPAVIVACIVLGILMIIGRSKEEIESIEEGLFI